MGSSGWIRLIRRGLVIYLVDGCVYTCWSRGGCRWMWVGVEKFRDIWARVSRGGLDGSDYSGGDW